MQNYVLETSENKLKPNVYLMLKDLKQNKKQLWSNYLRLNNRLVCKWNKFPGISISALRPLLSKFSYCSAPHPAPRRATAATIDFLINAL